MMKRIGAQALSRRVQGLVEGSRMRGWASLGRMDTREAVGGVGR